MAQEKKPFFIPLNVVGWNIRLDGYTWREGPDAS